jgi:hypothetical protein
MTIPDPVLNVVRQATADLVDANVDSASSTITGVGSILEGPDWKVSILMSRRGVPPQLQDYIKNLPIPAVTTVTGPFSFLIGSGDKIESQCVGGFGTLTAIVKDNSNAQFLLSCNHVLGGLDCQIDRERETIAQTTKLISFDNEPIVADAGIARLGMAVSTGLRQFPQLSSKQPVDLEAGAHVRHDGAVSNGASTIQEVNVTLRININGVFRRFRNVALVDPNFARKGDSGSLVINTDTQRPTGIVFARGQFERRPTKVAICSVGVALAALGVIIV